MLATIVNECANKPKYDILTFPTHERYESGLCKTGHNFWSYIAGEEVREIKRSWNISSAKIPDNYKLVTNIPAWVNFDFILSQTRFGQYELSRRFASMFKIPIITLEHTVPMPFWSKERMDYHKTQSGDIDVFISEYSKKAWGWEHRNNTEVIHHAIDTNFFCPLESRDIPYNVSHIIRTSVLSVGNDFINRDWALGFNLWRFIASHVKNVKVVGDTPGLSEPSKNIEEMRDIYQNSLIYLNTSLHSPIPMSLLEAMSCGCCPVSTNTCMIPDIIEDGKDGFLFSPKEPEKAIKKIKELQNNPEYAIEIGKRSRKKIKKMFGQKRFIEQWNEVFNKVLK